MFMTPYWLLPTVVLVLGYLLGSIPFGLLLTRVTGAGDLRHILRLELAGHMIVLGNGACVH